jgi:LETM1 and EF-hand domain-containing protein 1
LLLLAQASLTSSETNYPQLPSRCSLPDSYTQRRRLVYTWAVSYLFPLCQHSVLIDSSLAAHTRLPSALASRSVAQLRRNNRSSPSHLHALAILVPQQRLYSTETSTPQGSNPSFPPPGFNAEQAKKQLPADSRKASNPAASKDGNSDARPNVDPVTGKETKPSEKAILSEQGSAEAAIADADKRVTAEKKEESKKLTIGQKIKREIQHYWDGTKLLATEVRISTKLVMKMAAGYELSRRENRQVSKALFG